ncbi:hypothetical protein CesoFtcFv8_019363 [Champsocephalus esox]|uniref:SAM domain-containing protein n=1 Tax=Champsocephalus esox TaxID=159716 RepID=A0AAN8BJG6_9TELE|nr:hypothetical protein CesoFtcFv8_019363 [Champsocephalus esox]
MSASLDDTDSVFDLNEVPETELLDSSIQKGRAQLSVRARRQRPSRSRYRDSVSSTEGDDSLERKESPLHSTHSTHSPLHLAVRGSSPSPDSLRSARSPAFSFDSSLVRRSPDHEGVSLAAPPRGRYRQLTNATSQEALVTPSSPPSSRSCPPTDCPRVYMRRSRRPDSEVLVSDSSRDTSPGDPGSPTVVFDKKTKRRFLDLGVTLRRSYIRVRKDKSSRLSVGSRDPSESPSRSSSFVPFSWFSEGRGSISSSGTPPPSPKAPPPASPRPRRAQSQESALSEDFSPPADSCRSSHPYQTLSSDEPAEDTSCPASSWTCEQVCDWLRGIHMEQYVPEFNVGDIDGEQLLQMDSDKMKDLGVFSSSHRSALKRRVKDLLSAAEKEKKALRQKEKQRRRNNETHRN